MSFTSLTLSFIVTVISTPLFGKLAIKLNIVDKPDGYLKSHEKVTPYLGGLAIFFGVLLSTPFDPVIKVVLVTLVLVGTADDIRNLNPLFRLVVEFIVASLLAIRYLGLDMFTPVYVILTVALINAVNMMDGMDGVCASLSIISAIGLVLTATSKFDKILLLSLVGALAGYLIYNFPPARIFMGDGGSYLVGGILSSGVLSAFRNSGQTLHFRISAVIFVSLFLLDLVAAVLRRMINGRSPFLGDRDHTYNKIFRRVNNNRKTLLAIFSIGVLQFILGYIALSSMLFSILSVIALLVIYTFLIFKLELLKLS